MKAVVQSVTRCVIVRLLPEQILNLRSMNVVVDGTTWGGMIVVEGGRGGIEIIGVFRDMSRVKALNGLCIDLSVHLGARWKRVLICPILLRILRPGVHAGVTEVP